MQLWHQLGRHIHATASALVGEREDESRMFVPTGAGWAVAANAGFADFGQRALNGWPELLELVEKILTENRIGGVWIGHEYVYNIIYIHLQEQNEEYRQADFPPSLRHYR